MVFAHGPRYDTEDSSFFDAFGVRIMGGTSPHQKRPARITFPQNFMKRIPYMLTLLGLFWLSVTGNALTSEAAGSSVNSGKRIGACAVPTVQYFEQRLDHFNAQNDRTFHQRFWQQECWWKVPPDNGGKPLILLQVTSLAYPFELLNSTLASWAAQLGAMIFQLESRFTGQSLPANRTTTDLQYDTVEQHVQDLVQFISNATAAYGFDALEARWVLFGSLFDGAYITWFRSRYPNLSFGSISMSPFLVAMLQDINYDQTYQRYIGTMFGPGCASALSSLFTQLTLEWQAWSPVQQKEYQAQAGCTGSFNSSAEFFYVVSTLVLGYISDSVCANLTAGASLPLEDRLTNFALLTKALLTGSGLTCLQWDIAFDDGNQPFRSILYLQCAQLGQFQTSSNTSTSVIPTMVDLPWYLSVCRKLFNDKLPLPPNVDLFNNANGGDNPSGCNMIFITSTNDPYRTLGPDEGKIARTSSTNKMINMACPQIGVTYSLLYGPLSTDPPCLGDARAQVLQILTGWQTASAACETSGGDGNSGGDGDGGTKKATIVGVLVGIFGILIGIVIGGLIVYYVGREAFVRAKRYAWTKIN